MKDKICVLIGLMGGFISSLFGGWDSAITTLLIFMVADYISGMVVAGVFKKSPKTKTGALQSKAGWKGLAKKGMTLLFVIIAYRLDLLLGTEYIKDSVVIGFIANELISITENAGLMGLPMLPPIQKAIDILTTSGKNSK